MTQTEELILRRMYRNLEKHGLPDETAFFVDECPDRVNDYPALIPKQSDIGKPIMVFVSKTGDWTTLGVQGIGGTTDGNWQECLYADIERINGFPDGDLIEEASKDLLSKLALTTAKNTLIVETSPGENLFALWSTLNILCKLSKSAE